MFEKIKICKENMNNLHHYTILKNLLNDDLKQNIEDYNNFINSLNRFYFAIDNYVYIPMSQDICLYDEEYNKDYLYDENNTKVYSLEKINFSKINVELGLCKNPILNIFFDTNGFHMHYGYSLNAYKVKFNSLLDYMSNVAAIRFWIDNPVNYLLITDKDIADIKKTVGKIDYPPYARLSKFYCSYSIFLKTNDIDKENFYTYFRDSSTCIWNINTFKRFNLKKYIYARVEKFPFDNRLYVLKKNELLELLLINANKFNSSKFDYSLLTTDEYYFIAREERIQYE